MLLGKRVVDKRLDKSKETVSQFDFSFKLVDRSFLYLVLLIAGLGLFLVYEASVVYSDNVFGGKYHFLILQSGWVLLGLIGMAIFASINLEWLRKYSLLLFGVTILLLLFVLLPTVFAPSIYGARRWIYINPSPFPTLPILGRLSFQPSEIAKLTGVIFMSAILAARDLKKSVKSDPYYNFVFMGLFSSVLLLVCGLVAFEPNFSTAFIIAVIFLGMYFLSNGSLLYFLIVAPVLGIVAAVYAFSSEYRRTRIYTLFDPESIDKSGAGYHIRQIMIALGSGGFLGLGLGQSRQKYAYLPEVTADSIFAIVGEEFGWIGATVLILLFVMLIMRGIKIAKNAKNRFESALVTGVMVWISIQMIINLGAMARILPITGIPLPLISYGGSSAIFLLCGLGLVLNVSKGAKIEADKS